MDEVLISEDYILVIDTDQYAGHFAEELCAYSTGYVGENAIESTKNIADTFYMENGIEDDEKVLADDKNPFYGYVVDHQGEDGSWSPVAVWPSRLYGVNSTGEYGELTEDNYDNYNFPAGFSVGIYFAEEPPGDLIKLLKSRVDKFFEEFYPKTAKEGRESNVKVRSYRLIVHRKVAEERSI